jgi:hypothetical protein
MNEDPAKPEEHKFTVVYCGGCNPQIDRSALAAELYADPVLSEGGGGEVTVHLSGCTRACASGRSLTLEGTRVVVVAGECLDGRPTPDRELADTIRRKLKE